MAQLRYSAQREQLVQAARRLDQTGVLLAPGCIVVLLFDLLPRTSAVKMPIAAKAAQRSSAAWKPLTNVC